MSEERIFNRNYLLGFFASLAVNCSINYLLPIFPLYLKELSFNNWTIGLVISAYSLSAILLRPIVGQLTDRYSSKRLMLIGAILLTFAYPLYLITSVIPFLLLLRIFHGAGTAGFATASSIFVADISPKKKLAQAIGTYVISVSLSMGLAPLLGTYLMTKLSFPYLFLVPSLLALCAVVLILKIDYSRSRTQGAAGESISLSQILKDKNVLIPGLTWVSCSFTTGVIFAFLPLYVLGIKNTSSSIFFAMFSVTMVLVRFVGGGLSDRLGRKAIIIPSVLLVSGGVLGLAFMNSPISLALCSMIYGIGIGLGYPTMSALVVDHVAESNRGKALGIFSASVDAGQFLGSLTMGMISLVLGFRAMFLLTALLPLIGLSVFWYFYSYLPRVREELPKFGV